MADLKLIPHPTKHVHDFQRGGKCKHCNAWCHHPEFEGNMDTCTTCGCLRPPPGGRDHYEIPLGEWQLCTLTRCEPKVSHPLPLEALVELNQALLDAKYKSLQNLRDAAKTPAWLLERIRKEEAELEKLLEEEGELFRHDVETNSPHHQLRRAVDSAEKFLEGVFQGEFGTVEEEEPEESP